MTRLRATRSVCTGCHRPRKIKARGLCDACHKTWQDAHNERGRKVYDANWRRLRKRVLAAHRAAHGNWCPVCDTHGVLLTVDHVKPRSLERGVRVMCNRCNASKGNR